MTRTERPCAHAQIDSKFRNPLQHSLCSQGSQSKQFWQHFDTRVVTRATLISPLEYQRNDLVKIEPKGATHTPLCFVTSCNEKKNQKNRLSFFIWTISGAFWIIFSESSCLFNLKCIFIFNYNFCIVYLLPFFLFYYLSIYFILFLAARLSFFSPTLSLLYSVKILTFFFLTYTGFYSFSVTFKFKEGMVLEGNPIN